MDNQVKNKRNTSLPCSVRSPPPSGLEFFADGHYTPAYEVLGFYSSADFVELGAAFGVHEDEVRSLISRFASRHDAVERMLAASPLSPEARKRYLAKFKDRLRAIAQ